MNSCTLQPCRALTYLVLEIITVNNFKILSMHTYIEIIVISVTQGSVPVQLLQWKVLFWDIWENLNDRRESINGFSNMCMNEPTGLSATHEDHPITGVRECGLPLSYAATALTKIVAKASLFGIVVFPLKTRKKMKKRFQNRHWISLVKILESDFHWLS